MSANERERVSHASGAGIQGFPRASVPGGRGAEPPERRSWTRITACESIPPREGRAVSIGAREIAVFNLGDGEFAAIDNACPHRAGPLADGLLAGNAVVCPLHGWKVRLSTGCVERPSGTGACVRTHPVKVDDGVLLVQLPGRTSHA